MCTKTEFEGLWQPNADKPPVRRQYFGESERQLEQFGQQYIVLDYEGADPQTESGDIIPVFQITGRIVVDGGEILSYSAYTGPETGQHVHGGFRERKKYR